MEEPQFEFSKYSQKFESFLQEIKFLSTQTYSRLLSDLKIKFTAFPKKSIIKHMYDEMLQRLD